MQAMRTHRPRVSSQQPVAPSLALSSSYLRWLRPRRHAEHPPLQGPHVIGQASGPRWGTGPPRLGRAEALGRFRLRERLAEAGMGQTEIIVDMIQRQLLPQPVFALAQRIDPSPDRGDMLAAA